MENMKTIAVIESCDTKFKEAKFISDFIKNEGLNALVINTATGPAPSYNYDISREEIAESYGTPWEEMEPKSKGEKIDYMKDAVAAVEELEKMGLEVIGFHATGVGGATMEDMAANGLVDGILDLTLHELTSEYFGGGFSYGPKAKIRLVESVEKKVPLVISLGGLDFVDFSTSELPDRMDERKYMLHNANTAHIKILPEEAEALGKILAERLSKVTYPVKLLIPTKGMRHNTLEGQELYEPKSDSVLIQTIIENVNDNVEVIVIPHNLDTPEFGVKAAHYIVDEMKKQGKLPQDFGEN